MALVLDRFPPVCVVKDCLWFSCVHRCHLTERMAFGGWEAEMYAAWHAEALWCWRVWDALDDVQIAANCGNRAYFREKAAILRRLIGDEAWAAGVMPPCVPVWRFSWR